MYEFTEIVTDQLQLASHVKVLKAQEYNRYLQAQELVEAAEKKAALILQEAEEIFERKKEEGYQEGLALAQKDQSRVVMTTVEKCRVYFQECEHQIADIVLHAVRKLIGSFDDTDLTLKMTRQAMHAITNQRRVTLHVAPHQVDTVKAELGHVLKQFPEISYVEVTADDRVEPGGCLLETKVGVIDGTIDNQLAVIEEAVLNCIQDSAL